MVSIEKVRVEASDARYCLFSVYHRQSRQHGLDAKSRRPFFQHNLGDKFLGRPVDQDAHGQLLVGSTDDGVTADLLGYSFDSFRSSFRAFE